MYGRKYWTAVLFLMRSTKLSLLSVKDEATPKPYKRAATVEAAAVREHHFATQ